MPKIFSSISRIGKFISSKNFMKKPRIVIISHAYVVDAYRKKIEELVNLDKYEVTLIVPKFGLEGGGRKVYTKSNGKEKYRMIIQPTIGTGRPNSYIFIGLGKLLKELEPDIVQIEEEFWTNCALQIVYIVRKNLPKTKIILASQENICHNWKSEGTTWYQKLRFGVFDWIEKFVLSRIDVMVFQFGYLKAEFVDKFNAKKFAGQYAFIPQLGVDYERFMDIDSQKVLDLKMNSGLVAYDGKMINKKFIFGYLGRLVPEKGLDDLVDAFAKVEDKNVKLLLVGNGSQKYVANLKSKINKHTCLKNRVTFLSAVGYDDIPVMLELMDVMVLPSRTRPEWKEQFGRVLVEAMAAGTVVIGSNSGAIPYVLGEGGLIFEEGSVSDLSQKMNMLLKDEKLRKGLRQKATDRVVRHFTYKAIAKKQEKLFEQVLG
jgi:glycosyltransferase involved in cell wall biosynthesis